jgi:hypothetical protein
MEAKICDDVDPEHAEFYPRSEFAQFSAAAEGCIAARRAEWAGAFGNASLAATTNEVYQRFILPQCQPVLKVPTC